MPVKKIRFAQEETGRTAAPATPIATKDWEFLNLTPEVVVNPMTQGAEVWATTFTGTTELYADLHTSLYRTFIWSGNSDAVVATGFAGTTAYFNVNGTEIGTVTTGSAGIVCTDISETRISGTAIVVFIVLDAAPSPDTVNAYYFASDAGVAGTTFVGDTHSNAIIDNIASTAGIYRGQTVTGAGIPANSFVSTVDSATQITMNNNATATTAGVTITRTALAKITGALFPPGQTPALTIVGNMIHMDGYAMVACSNGTLWNSSLNSLTTWALTQFVSADSKPDNALALGLLNNTVIVFGSNSIDFFQNAGLASGSPLQKIPAMSLDIGLYSSLTTVSIPWVSLLGVVDGIIYFVGNTSTYGSGEVGVYKMQRPGVVQKISDGLIDKLLAQAGVSGGESGFAGSGVMNGQKFVSLYISISGGSTFNYFYYPASGLWWRQNLLLYGVAGNKGITYSVSAGTSVFKTDLTTRATGTAIVRCGMDNYNSDARKFVSKITVIGDRKATSANSTVSLYTDDYSTTASSQSVDLSLVRPIVTRCGAGYNLAPEFSDADTQHVRIKGFDVEYTVGT